MGTGLSRMESLAKAATALRSAKVDYDQAAHAVAEQAAFQGWNKIKLQALVEYHTSRAWFEQCAAHTAELHDLAILEHEEQR